MSDDIARPEGIVLHRPDGTMVACEPAYAGLNDDGQHVWEVLTPAETGDRVTVKVLPAHAAIVFPVASEDEQL